MGLSLFWLNLGTPVRCNPSPCLEISSSKRPLDIGYPYRGNRRRAAFENPSGLCGVRKVGRWPLVALWV